MIVVTHTPFGIRWKPASRKQAVLFYANGEKDVFKQKETIEIFSISTETYDNFAALCAEQSITMLDTIASQLEELAKIHTVGQPPEAIARFIAKEIEPYNHCLNSYGSWVYYPWRRMVVHLLPKEAFRQVRTNRNQEKITAAEQALLLKKCIGVIGLSVGHSAAITLVQEGICGEIRIADFDTIALSNLNRLRTSLVHLDLKKTTAAYRDIMEIDPYITVKIYPQGMNDQNIESFFLEDGKIDLLVEECDTLPVKIKSRLFAKKNGIPVVMDTNDRGLIDIERFDQEPNREIFHRIFKNSHSDFLSDLPQPEKLEVIVKLLGGRESLSAAMQDSIQKLGKTLVGFPQLASEVHLGGALVTYVSRNILLEKKMLSGRYYVELSELVGI